MGGVWTDREKEYSGRAQEQQQRQKVAMTVVWYRQMMANEETSPFFSLANGEMD